MPNFGYPDDGGHCPECGCDLEVIGPPGPPHAKTCSEHWSNRPKDTSEDLSHLTDAEFGELLRNPQRPFRKAPPK